ncbi:MULTISPECIES: hypothetical protein [unclassified Paenibacillus]|uniref:hypothetical protein n=1 Tax=unclassified Paenibacillus TaxID=185978 RepID=UPI0009A8C630|nr:MULTISPECIES: hypothetical protein [unclassified Paenibacillus]SLK17347.1 hypothetical protein SAMN06272722_11172 [Paenibacillus sp. RU5A]SOC74720.1 hypothetical protein SAMN05880581_11172 [Paenibacillus sp. RU26A]SOC76860.1 hypothetical protein SAMN05880586_11172 [Paenibacillus sp. RU5M]
MIDLTSDVQFATLIQTNSFPKDCLTFIHDYMQKLRDAHEGEAFLPSGEWFILETTDELTPIQHDETVFSCLTGTYYPEYIERYTFNEEELSLYKIYVMLDNECRMTFFTLQGIHSVETEQWLIANTD